MSGSVEVPHTFDENFLLVEALERALRNGDTPSDLTGPALTELSSLVILVRRLQVSADTVRPSDPFRKAGRTRLVASMRGTAARSASRVRQPQRPPWRFRLAVPGWFTRVGAALSAVALAGAATASASASALPGDSLYGIKQAAEQVALVTAADDAGRQQVLRRQADTRLEETSRLLEQGRDAEAGQNALRYSEVLEGTTGPVGAPEPVETTLQADSARLASLLAAARPPARPGLQRALEAAERGLARVRRAAPSEVHVPLPQPPPPVVVQPERSATSGPPQRSATSGPREHPAPSGSAVDKPRGAPLSEVQPTRHGRP